MSNPIADTQKCLGKFYTDANLKGERKKLKAVLVSDTCTAIQKQYLRKEEEGGIYCIKILAINGVDLSIKDINNREYVLLKVGVAKNYTERYKCHGFSNEKIFEINGDHLMENWLLTRMPGSVRDAFVGKGLKVSEVRKKLGFYYTAKGGPSPGATEWRIVTPQFYERLKALNQGVDWLGKMNNFNYRSEFRKLASGTAGSGDVDFPSYSLLFPAQKLKFVREVPGGDVVVLNTSPLRVMCLPNEAGGGGFTLGTGAARVRVKRDRKDDGKYFESIPWSQEELEKAWADGETELDNLREVVFEHFESDDEVSNVNSTEEEGVDSTEDDTADSEASNHHTLKKLITSTHQIKIVSEHKSQSIPSQAPVAHR